MQQRGRDRSILVTGGTSGLGLALVRALLAKGHHVVATGRQRMEPDEFTGKLVLYNVDFNDLGKVAASFREISRAHSFGIIVNNAGILSPPDYTETKDGFEYTFQVNFLAQLLINEIILQSVNDDLPLRIAAITSPVYRFAEVKTDFKTGSDGYRPMRAYSSSKLYLAMMNDLLQPEYNGRDLQCFSYNPGTFSSGISRMQKGWFRGMYQIAAPFMRSPAKVAAVLAWLLTIDKIRPGMIYDIAGQPRPLPVINEELKRSFIIACREITTKYLTQG